MARSLLGQCFRQASLQLPPRIRTRLRSTGAIQRLLRYIESVELNHALQERDGLTWERSRPCPYSLYDAGGAQIGHLLYVVCGYRTLDSVSNDILVFDLRRERWVQRISTPKELAHSHCAVATDAERFIYFASGQLGAQCRPAIRDAFSFDTKNNLWRRLPSVPEPRYAGTMQIWNGRLHIIGGAADDRWTPTASHWSLKVSEGRAVDDHWREELPIPVPGMHRGSALVEGRLYIFGGQQGDFQPIPGDLNCTCTGKTKETYLQCTFRLKSPSGIWERLEDLPIPASHLDFSTVVMDHTVLLVGGQVYKHPDEYYLRLTDVIQAYDTRKDRWTIAGHLPYRLKIPVVGHIDNQLFVTTGQRGVEQGDTPGAITSQTWKTRLLPPDNVTITTELANARELKTLTGKNVFLISHDLTQSGAPLLLMETAQAMILAGATVRLASVADDGEGWNLSSAFRIPLVPIETAFQHAQDADLIVANTAQASTWVRCCLEHDATLANRLAWWVHEIDVEYYQQDMALIERSSLAIFDSHASLAAWANAVPLPKRALVVHPALSEDCVAITTRSRLPFPRNPGLVNSRTIPLTREIIRERLDVSPEDFLVCSISWYGPRKGQRMLISTLAKTAMDRGCQLKLLLVGLNNEGQRLALLNDLSEAERRVLSPSLTYLSQREIGAFYRASDAFVMNSQGRTGRGECFGRVTIEAMAFGLPVLGTAAGGTAEILTDGVTGLLYPVGEQGQEVLANHLEQLICQPKKARDLGQAAREHVMTYFRMPRFLKELNDAFAGVLDPQNQSPDGVK